MSERSQSFRVLWSLSLSWPDLWNQRPLYGGVGGVGGAGRGAERLLTEGKVFGKRRLLRFGNCRASSPCLPNWDRLSTSPSLPTHRPPGQPSFTGLRMPSSLHGLITEPRRPDQTLAASLFPQPCLLKGHLFQRPNPTAHSATYRDGLTRVWTLSSLDIPLDHRGDGQNWKWGLVPVRGTAHLLDEWPKTQVTCVNLTQS